VTILIQACVVVLGVYVLDYSLLSLLRDNPHASICVVILGVFVLEYGPYGPNLFLFFLLPFVDGYEPLSCRGPSL
jgi:hypothetical protein